MLAEADPWPEGAGASGAAAAAGSGGQGTAGGAGGDAPSPCGTFDVLADDFERPSGLWYGTLNTAFDGAAVLDLSGSLFGQFVSHRTYSLAGGGISVRVDASAAAPDVTMAMTLFDPTVLTLPSRATMVVDGSMLHGSVNAGDEAASAVEVFSVRYSPDAHARWRIRENAGLVVFETATLDGDYQERGSTSTSMAGDIDILQAEFHAASGAVGAGSVAFDDVNQGTTSASFCPMASFTEDFSVEMRSWLKLVPATCVATLANGALQLTTEPESSDCSWTTWQSFDLTGSHARVRVPALSVDTPSYALMRLRFDAEQQQMIGVHEGQLRMTSQVAGRPNWEESVAFLPSEHRWWGIRHDGTRLLFETSEDGSTWSTLRDIPPPPFLEGMTIGLAAGNFGEPAAFAGSVQFDDLNREP